MFKNKKGFTLIELLVVIAIIGILSSVVLASLNSARNKGNNAKIKAQLASARAAAEIYYDSNSQSYGTAANCTTAMFADTISGMVQYATAANYPGTPAMACFSNGTSYVMSALLSTAEGTATAWCVDSVGNSKGRVGNVTAVGNCNQ